MLHLYYEDRYSKYLGTRQKGRIIIDTYINLPSNSKFVFKLSSLCIKILKKTGQFDLWSR